MSRNISEIPQRWIIIKLDGFYKVFGTWEGSYTEGDRWILNSGIKDIEEDEESYYFIGFSGSCYKCDKKKYGVATPYGQDILNKILEHGKNKLKVMPDQNDWIKFIKNDEKHN